MKIGWVTPLAKASAIGRVSAIVCDALGERGHEVDIIRSETPDFLTPEHHPTRCTVLSVADVSCQAAMENYDVVFVNVGDNFNFHGGIFAYLQPAFAIGIVHDFYLFNLFNGWRAQAGLSATRASQEIVAAYGADHAEIALRAIHGEMDVEELARKVPMTEWIARRCASAISHAEFYLPRLRAGCGGVVEAARLPWPGRNIPPPEQKPGKRTVVTVGVVNPNKCADLVIEAIGSSDALRAALRYVIAGPIEEAMRVELESSARRSGVDFEALGAVDDERLVAALTDADMVCCLRRPVLEGASASAIEGLLSGRPTIVADDGFYAELPDEHVVKVRGDFDAGQLAKAFERLVADDAARLQMGQSARTWAAETFSVDAYVQVLETVARDHIRMGPYLDLADRVARRLAVLGLDASSANAGRFSAAIDSLRRFDAPSPHRM